MSRESGRQLGIKLGGRRTEPGIFIMEILEGSVASHDGRLHPQDRILAINGGDVRYARLDLASKLIQQSRAHVCLIVSRGPINSEYDHLFKQPHPSLSVAHSRTKSAPDRLAARIDNSPALSEHNKSCGDVVDSPHSILHSENNERSASVESLNDHQTNLPPVSNTHSQSNGSLASPRSKRRNSDSLGSLTGYGTQYQSNGSLGSAGHHLNQSTSSLISPLRSSQTILDIEETLEIPPALPPRSRQPLPHSDSHDHLEEHNLLEPQQLQMQTDGAPIIDSPETTSHTLGNGLSAAGGADVPDGPVLSRSKGRRTKETSDITDLCHGIRKSLKIEGAASHQKTVTISKVSSF